MRESVCVCEYACACVCMCECVCVYARARVCVWARARIILCQKRTIHHLGFCCCVIQNYPIIKIYQQNLRKNFMKFYLKLQTLFT